MPRWLAALLEVVALIVAAVRRRRESARELEHEQVPPLVHDDPHGWFDEHFNGVRGGNDARDEV